ncbi:MAG: C1 family peptidase [Alphaproteobacteria bacterium]|nr:C1 family peptidase [Alphaproteobacteria bacterium]
MPKILPLTCKVFFVLSLSIALAAPIAASSFVAKELIYGAERQFKRLVGIPPTPRSIIEMFNIHAGSTRILREEITSYDPKIPKHSLRQFMSPPKNQGESNSCVSFASIAALERFNPGIRLSEGQIAKLANIESEGVCAPDGIMNLGVGMNYVRDKGVVEEKYWGFNDSNVCLVEEPSNFQRLRKFNFRSVHPLLDRDDGNVVPFMRQHLRDGRIPKLTTPALDDGDLSNIRFTLLRDVPVVVEIPIASADGVMVSGWEDGRKGVKLPPIKSIESWLSDSENASMPYHAITLVGYDDTTGSFEFKNHWWDKERKAWWGNGGYSTIPYEYIKYYARLSLYGTIPGIG